MTSCGATLGSLHILGVQSCPLPSSGSQLRYPFSREACTLLFYPPHSYKLFCTYICLLCLPDGLFIPSVLSRFSRVQLFVTPWTVAYQVTLSVGFSRQEYWSGLSCSPPGDLPDPGIKPGSLTSPALAGGFFTPNITDALYSKSSNLFQPVSAVLQGLSRKQGLTSNRQEGTFGGNTAVLNCGDSCTTL